MTAGACTAEDDGGRLVRRETLHYEDQRLQWTARRRNYCCPAESGERRADRLSEEESGEWRWRANQETDQGKQRKQSTTFLHHQLKIKTAKSKGAMARKTMAKKLKDSGKKKQYN
ncbi:hypothetical protein PIB30_086097, partial [Stylosanthes scabra]|nr:hypothetical protein [Stylosanthes scabra]